MTIHPSMSDPDPKAAPRTVPVRRTRGMPLAVAPGVDDDPPPSVKGAGGPPRPRPKVVGARAPDETGMLPLTPNGREVSPSSDPSATAFFALPTPARAEKPRPAPPAAPAAAPPAPAPVITGPVAGAAPPPTPVRVESSNEGRVVSWRVWAVLLAMFALACFSFVAVAGIWLWRSRDAEEVVVTEPKPVTPVAASTSPPLVEEPPADPVIIQSAPRTPRRTTPVATPPPEPVPTPPPAATTGTVTISFSGDLVPSAVEVVCDATGFRERKSVAGNRVTISNVPAGVSCKGVPKGVPASNFGVKAGGSYTCTITGTTTSCGG